VSRRFKEDKKMPGHDHLINDQIRASEMLVIDHVGQKRGVISKREALQIADDAGLDLVQVGEKDSNVIAKIMDFGKFLYSKKKQLNESKKKQKVIQLKEIKMRPNIGDQDYNTKFNRAVEFLKDGKKVKFTLQFRGREMIMKNEIGNKFFIRIDNDLNKQDLGTLIKDREQRGRGPFWSRIYSLKVN